jgi:hypothetical protein
MLADVPVSNDIGTNQASGAGRWGRKEAAGAFVQIRF